MLSNPNRSRASRIALHVAANLGLFGLCYLFVAALLAGIAWVVTR